MTFTLWFTGRPAAGKSTLGKRAETRLREAGILVENFDGDEIRQNLHPDLGFSREDRALNNRRTAFICMLLNRNGISVVNAMITPFRDSQHQAREIIEPEGEFVLVYVKCSVEECERRDPKDLYQQAREGNIENFTGISHPFQPPHNPDIVVNTEELDPDECVERVFAGLSERGLLDDEAIGEYQFDLTRAKEAEVFERLKELEYIDQADEG